MGQDLRSGAPGLTPQSQPAAPVFVVHALGQAIAAAQAAAEAGRDIVLLSAADAGISAGAGWFAALAAAAREAAPAARFAAVLDCGDDAGAAQSAIVAGIDEVVFTGRADVADRLAAIAHARGLRLLTARPGDAKELLPLFFLEIEVIRRHCAEILAGLSAIC